MYDWAEFRHFRYLLTVLERQGFRAAADELHTAQPNLSVHAKQFQENASIRLFRKTKSGRIRVTETGMAFMMLARYLLETRDEVIDALIDIERGSIRSIRVGCATLADPILFQELCSRHKAILPACSIRPTHGDTAQLVREVVAGTLDAAVVTLPLNHPDLKIEELRQDRLVACLRRDDPLARKTALQPKDLQNNLAVLYHPERHPDAHERLLEQLGEAGILVEEYARASHPSEIQALVKQGYGFALIREGTSLERELTTRPVAGVDWKVDTVAIYHKHRHPKTLPLLIKQLKKQNRGELNGPGFGDPLVRSVVAGRIPKQPCQSANSGSTQLSLLEKTERIVEEA